MARNWTSPTEEEFQRQYQAATRAGRAADEVEPRALDARYDTQRDRIVLELAGGCTFAFPVRSAPWLAGIPPERLPRVEVTVRGAGLRWEEDDVDLSVPGVVAYFLDMDHWAPRYMGQRTTEAKARAARENGMKGGRPRGVSRSPRTGVVREGRTGATSGTGSIQEKQSKPQNARSGQSEGTS